MFGVSHDIDDELIYVRPTKVITIGPKSKSCVLEHLLALGGKTEVMSVSETVAKPIETEEMAEDLAKEIAAKLGVSSSLPESS